jgi:hypothetical protein
MGQLSLTKILLELYIHNSEKILSSNEIIDYIKYITPSESDIPDYFLSLIEKSNKNFKLKKLSIKKLMTQDISLKDYIESKEDRYGDDLEGDYIPDYNELENPIVVFNGKVIDGYSRTATHYHNGDDTIYGYVSI